MIEKSWGWTQKDLQDVLADWLRDLFKDTRYKTIGNQMAPPNIYKQFLPILTEDSESDVSYYPYILIAVPSGEIKDWDTSGKSKEVQVLFYFGVYDEDKSRRGYIDTLNIAQKIENALGKQRRVQNFTVESPFQWAVDVDDTHPYYYGVIEAVFSAPRVIKEDPLA